MVLAATKTFAMHPFKVREFSILRNGGSRLRTERQGEDEDARDMDEHARDAASAAIVAERPGMVIGRFPLLTIRALAVEEVTMAHRLLTCFSEIVQ